MHGKGLSEPLSADDARNNKKVGSTGFSKPDMKAASEGRGRGMEPVYSGLAPDVSEARELQIHAASSAQLGTLYLVRSR